MNIRCTYCRRSFNLTRDYIGQAITEVTANKQKHHVVECPHCRKHNKVALRQLKRFAPATDE